ncbi:MAG: FHA domain-containing protein [Archangium sp.]|nr:FHA domain-containing protein [Archangium sp.]
MSAPVVEFADQSGKRVVPLKEQNGIGRNDDCSVAVKSPTMSRRHGELNFENGRWMLSDLGSASGTWVDGKQIKPSCELHDGQTFRMGNVDFVLRLT